MELFYAQLLIASSCRLTRVIRLRRLLLHSLLNDFHLKTLLGRLIVRVILAIMRFNPHLITAVMVCVSFNITMPIKLFQIMKVEMMQVRVVAHRLHRRVEANVIAAV